MGKWTEIKAPPSHHSSDSLQKPWVQLLLVEDSPKHIDGSIILGFLHT